MATSTTVTSTRTATSTAIAADAETLSIETVVICIVILCLSFILACLILRVLQRNFHRLNQRSFWDDLEAQTPRSQMDDAQNDADPPGESSKAEEVAQCSQTPEVWKATALSEYVSLTLDLIHSAFSEGATGVTLVGIKPLAADFELWEWLELHQHLKTAVTDLQDVALLEVTFESLGEELNMSTREGGTVIIVYTGGEDFQAAANARSTCVKIVESNVMAI